jgi:hypothetical protein
VADALDHLARTPAIATRGGWGHEGRFVPMPLVSTAAAEQLFRHSSREQRGGLAQMVEVITLMRYGCAVALTRPARLAP